jgi:hypothetical protein
MNDTSPDAAELAREMLMARSGADRVLMDNRINELGLEFCDRRVALKQ